MVYHKSMFLTSNAHHLALYLFVYCCVLVCAQVHGPKGKFNITTEKLARDPRRVQVSYHPTDVGVYVVEIVWSEAPVPGSPFSLNISQSSPQHTSHT